MKAKKVMSLALAAAMIAGMTASTTVNVNSSTKLH